MMEGLFQMSHSA
jgi:hypothetical protein